MVESDKSTLTKDLQSVIDQALRSGMDAEAIARMVAERALTVNDVARNGLASETPPEDTGDVIYERDNLPPGLIDLPTAAKRYHLNNTTVRSWVAKGLVPAKGRLRAPAAKGGYVVVCEADLVAYMNAPRNKGGRPKKPQNKSYSDC